LGLPACIRSKGMEEFYFDSGSTSRDPQSRAELENMQNRMV
jgi:hypothetical protein